MPPPPHPDLIMGSGTIGLSPGAFSSPESVAELVDTMWDLGIRRIDVSSRHPPGTDYLAEKLYGATGVVSKGFKVDFKNHIVERFDARGSMSRENVRRSVEGSRERLGLEAAGKKAETFWCYSPDESTPLEEQAGAVDEEYRRGGFEKFGLSNFSAQQIEDWIAVCEAKGYAKPTVYQGMYNLIIREAETSLFPTLRKHGMAFNAWQALAAGFLSGKATTGQAEGTRYDPAHPFSRFVRDKYDKEHYHAAVRRLLGAMEPHGIGAAEGALRWICYHSKLGEGDGVLLGASRLEQVKANAEAVEKGPLPDDVVAEIEEVWKDLSEFEHTMNVV